MIVNPWFFYVLQLCSNLKSAVIALGVVLIAVSFGAFISNDVYGTEFPVKKPLIAGIVLIALYPFIPAKDTLLMMKASEFVTSDNVKLTVDALKQAIDYAATLF